jgi:biopolymer transport protein TolR
MRPTIVSDDEAISSINVTPIIDVALVLVIILLITAPILTVTDMEVTLPEAQTRGPEDEARLSITLNEHGELAIDDAVIDRRSFSEEFRARLANTDTKKLLVIVRADARAPHTSVRELLEEARDAGAERIAIATRQRRGKPR